MNGKMRIRNENYVLVEIKHYPKWGESMKAFITKEDFNKFCNNEIDLKDINYDEQDTNILLPEYILEQDESTNKKYIYKRELNQIKSSWCPNTITVEWKDERFK